MISPQDNKGRLRVLITSLVVYRPTWVYQGQNPNRKRAVNPVPQGSDVSADVNSEANGVVTQGPSLDKLVIPSTGRQAEMSESSVIGIVRGKHKYFSEAKVSNAEGFVF